MGPTIVGNVNRLFGIYIGGVVSDLHIATSPKPISPAKHIPISELQISPSMERTLFLEVHRDGRLKRTKGAEALLSTHTYIGGDVRTWRVPKSAMDIRHLLGALGYLDDYHPNSYWFFEDIKIHGAGYLRPLQTQEDADALARLGETRAGIRVFVEHGVEDIGSVLPASE